MLQLRQILLPVAALALSACAPVSFVCADNAPLCSIAEVVGQNKKTAGGIRIDRIELTQGVAIDLMEGGLATEPKVGIVAGRETMVRVYVSPNDDYQVRDIAARMILWLGDEIVGAAEGVGRPVGESSIGSLGSTINILFDAGSLPAGNYTWTVELVEAETSSTRLGKVDGAAFPPAGETSPNLEVTDVGPATRLYIIPIILTSKNETPSTGESALQAIHAAMKGVYPVRDIELEVGPSIDWEGPTGNLQAILQEVSRIRTDQPDRGIDPDQFVFGLLPSVDTGVAGLSWLGGSPLDTGGRNSVGIQWSLPHEVGHAHGRSHADCGGAAGANPEFPYEQGGIGTWGWDHQTDTLYDPAVYKDLMSYCDPTWTSDYYWHRNFVKTLGIYEGYYKPDSTPRAVERSYQELWVYDSGDVTWGRSDTWVEPAGQPRRVERFAADGSSLGTVDAIWSPMQHIEGGVLLVPDEVEFASVRLLDTAFVPVENELIVPIELEDLLSARR
jgi:hypothetical protein